MPERAAQHQLAHDPLDRPAVADEPIGQVVEQLRMGGPIAEHPEVVDGRDEAPAEDVVPDAIHRDSRRQGVGRIGDPPGEVQASAAGRSGRRPAIAREGREHPAGHDRADGLRVAAEEDPLVLGRPVGHGRCAPGLGEPGLELPERLRAACRIRPVADTSSSSRPRSTSQASRADRASASGRSGKEPSASAASDSDSGAAVSLGEGEGRIDRRVPEQADHHRGRAGGRGPLIGEEGAADGDESVGAAAGRRAHVVEILRRGVRELEIGAPAPPHLQVERVPARGSWSRICRSRP